jgi:hypothetical protein
LADANSRRMFLEVDSSLGPTARDDVICQYSARPRIAAPLRTRMPMLPQHRTELGQTGELLKDFLNPVDYVIIGINLKMCQASACFRECAQADWPKLCEVRRRNGFNQETFAAVGGPATICERSGARATQPDYPHHWARATSI